MRESVWDYPRPPRVEPCGDRVVVRFNGQVLVDTASSFRVLETSHPPGFYLPRADFSPGALQPARRRTVCEFKGVASYFDVVIDGRRADAAAWLYPDPAAGYEVLRHHVALYPGLMDECTVNGEVVTKQEGDFYGGWITENIVGPFKGAPGTLGW
ncbi:DUF427 domain-containing protein [Cryobacterium melibiosiphilum]|uniref:DUF427 domain-containing protein n=1 Tax=Cryobacterium melibiosiphilum TaxID=995039 RepID=A0A3A5MC35_9MICO|nr:DUF427 domain-containing protein [Cryobacterium melibiosiphilum]RJT87697.1 DUF427 domain-containing protein [Cryobacterium melibiosiphilum]